MSPCATGQRVLTLVRPVGLIFVFGLTQHRLSHLKHHAQTNVSGKDPEMDVQDMKLRVKRSFIDIFVLVGFSIAGLAPEILLLWYVATRLAFMWVVFIFSWYPHHPHQETERYRDKRVATFFGSTLLIRGHDHHLLHHLYSRVVHYKLPKLWANFEPVMVARGARIEGNASRDGLAIQWSAQ